MRVAPPACLQVGCGDLVPLVCLQTVLRSMSSTGTSQCSKECTILLISPLDRSRTRLGSIPRPLVFQRNALPTELKGIAKLWQPKQMLLSRRKIESPLYSKLTFSMKQITTNCNKYSFNALKSFAKLPFLIKDLTDVPDAVWCRSRIRRAAAAGGIPHAPPSEPHDLLLSSIKLHFVLLV